MEDYYIDKILNIGEKKDFEVDIFISYSENLTCELDGDSLDSIQQSNNFGIGVRVIKDNKVGFAYSTKPGEEIIYKAMENLVLDEYTTIPEPTKDLPNPKGIFHKDLLNIEEEEIIEDLNAMKNILIEEEITVTGGSIDKVYSQNRIVNSKGLDIEEKFTYYSASISGIKNGETAYDYLTRTHVFDVKQLSNNVVELLSLPKSTKIQYEGNILLTPRVLGSLLTYTLLPSFNSENIQRNRSLLKGKLGEEVFGEHITIVDDGTLNKGLYSSKVDGEGTPREKITLVEKGILKNYLYDIKRANIENKKSTGHGVRDYNTLPTISPSNIIIEPNDKLDNYNEYLCVNGLIGCHTSNPITGNFSVEIFNSYIVKDGEKIPIKKGMLSGNMFEVLKGALPMDDVDQRGRYLSPSIMMEGKIIL